MAKQEVGKVYVSVEAQTDGLRAGMEKAKAQAAASGSEMGKAIGTGVEAGTEQAKKSIRSMNGVLDDTAAIITGVIGKVTALVGLGVALGNSIANYRSTWRAINTTLDNIFDSTKKSTEAIGVFADKSRELMDSLREARISEELATTDDPRAAYELKLQLEAQLHAKQMENIARLAAEQRKALFAAGVVEEEIDQRIRSFRQTAEEAENERTRQKRFTLGKQLFAEEDRRRKDAEKAAAQEKDRQQKELIDIQRRYMQDETERFEQMKKAADDAGRIFARHIQQATDSLRSAVESFNEADQSGGIGASAQYLGQKLEGVIAVMDSIRAGQSSDQTTVFSGF